MDLNTRLDGFVIHPLDAFNDKHQNDNLTKFSTTAPNLDGFAVHPLDNFISQEHSNNNIDTNVINQVTQIDNIFSNNNIYETGNTLNNDYLTNLGFNQTQTQDLFPTSTTINNDFNINQYDTYNTTYSSTYPITYTEPTNYNYSNNITTNIYSTSQSSNYINITPTYENYSSTNNYNYTRVLPPKFLPTIHQVSNVNSNSTINLIPKTTPKIVYNTTSFVTPIQSIYTTPSTQSIRGYTPAPNIRRVKTLNTLPTSQIMPFSTITYRKTPYSLKSFGPNSLNTSGYNYKPRIIHFKSNSSILPSPNYRIASFNPRANWNKIIPQTRKIIIPKAKKYFVPRRSRSIITQRQSILIPNPVVVQPQQSIQTNINVPTIIISNPSQVNNLSNNIVVPTITLPNTLNVNMNESEKYPRDNVMGRRRMLKKNNIPHPKIYYPRNFEKRKYKKY